MKIYNIVISTDSDIHEDLVSGMKDLAIKYPGTNIEVLDKKNSVTSNDFDFIANGYVAQLSTKVIGDKFAVIAKSNINGTPLFACALSIDKKGLLSVSTPQENKSINDESVKLFSTKFTGFTTPISS